MKKIILCFLFSALGFAAKAQSNNEIKLNFLNTIVLGSVEVGYEHYLDSVQSIGVEFLINDRFSYYPQGEDGREFKTNSYLISYNFYFIQGIDPSSFYISPFVKYRDGTYLERNENDILTEMDMDSAMIGIGAGYKWVYNGQLVLAPFVNIARGFSKVVADRFTPVEVNAGFSIGYRF
jgi:hypothetical protein